MRFREGDILFQDVGCGAVCDAIEGVTPGYEGAEINHCGVVVARGGEIRVLEAVSPRVAASELSGFLSRAVDAKGRPKILVGRVRSEFEVLVAPAVAWMWSRIGSLYDHAYQPDDTALYCSELVVRGFRRANGGAAFFPEAPMTFRDPLTDEILPFWVHYFEALGMEVPEGVVGSNPGTLSLSPRLEIIARLGDLRGLHPLD